MVLGPYHISMRVGLSLLYLEVKGSSLKEWFSSGPAPGLYEIVDNGPLSPSNEDIEKLRRMEGFTYTVHGPYDRINIASRNLELREISIEAHKRSMQIAHKLEAEVYVLHSGGANGGSRELNKDAIYKLMEFGEGLGLKVGLENGYPGSGPLTYLPEHFKELEDVPIILDIGHAFVAGVLDEFLEMGDRIIEVHFHDNDGIADSHLCLGDGIVPWPKVVERLRSMPIPGIIESVHKPFLSFKRLSDALKK